MATVFVSHAAEDQPWISAELLLEFRRHGVDYWYARDDIALGTIWEDAIRDNLRKCDWFLVVVSTHSAASRYVRAEVDLAARMLSPDRILVARLDETDPAECKLWLPQIQSVDLRHAPKESIGKLVARIKAAGGSAPHSSTSQPRRQNPTISPSDRTIHPRQAKATATDIRKLFSALGSTDHTLREGAAASLAQIDWSTIVDAVDATIREPDRAGIEGILLGLATWTSHQRTVELLERMCGRLRGGLHKRAIDLLEYKRLSLDRERLDGYFRRNNAPFHITQVLGNGLFAASFLARHQIDDEQYVVRLLLPGHAHDDTIRSEFLQKAKQSRRHIHPRLVVTREIGQLAGDRLYYSIRDYIDAPTVHALLERRTPIPPSIAIRVLIHVAEAALAVHEQGDVHHGIKPANIYLLNGRDGMLGDASLPIAFVPPRIARLVFDGRYAAPECFDSVTAVSPASDTYSLGCVAYHLLCGHPPFVADTVMELSRRHTSGLYELPSRMGCVLGSRADDVLGAMLRPNPAARTADPLAALRSLADLIAKELPPADGENATPTRVPVPPVIEYSIVQFLHDQPSAPQPTPPQPGTAQPGVPDEPQPSGETSASERRSPTADEPPQRVAPRDQSPVTEPREGENRLPPDEATRRGETSGTDRPTDATWIDPTYLNRLPEWIGPYRVIRMLGQGGMGVVYLARHEELPRDVAVKVLHPGRLSSSVQARFRAEVRLLASMSHPNIATIFETGTTPEGDPYMAMELINGDPITTFCDRQRLTIRERLDLFIEVCSGVNHAHQRGIIHRDLKPANILVTDDDGRYRPVIIDFGIAKAVLGMNYQDGDSLRTEAGQFVGTPEYASPEQLLGDSDVDARSDIFSLGVLLYQLLTGSTPFDIRRDRGMQELRRAVLDEPVPPLLSRPLNDELVRQRGSTLPAVRRALSFELECIVQMAMRKSPRQRYASVADLQRDVLRYVRNEPALAAPSSVGYRARKWVQRHRLAGIGLLLAVALGGVALLLWLLS